jgi:putative nucleotidyltransferase with HDIG domain/PAS domain S-box-containing protein
MDKENRSFFEDTRDTSEIVLFGLFFEKILKNLDAVAMVTSTRGHVKFVSRKFLDFFGVNPKDVLGENWVDVTVLEEKKRAARELFAILKEDEKLVQFDFPVARTGKKQARVLWTASPLTNRDAEKMYFFIGMKGGKTPVKDLTKNEITDLEIKEIREQVARLLFEASEKCDSETAKHALRVMFFAERLALEMGLSPQKVEDLKTASLLHDLGKLAVDPGILFKSGKLSQEEFEHVKKHLVWGADLLRRMHFLEDIVTIMCSHHENYDGRGYPDGISGENIPLEARILCVADIYEALTADRTYREAFSLEEAIAIMEYEKGHKLDPFLTDVFIRMLRKGEKPV